MRKMFKHLLRKIEDDIKIDNQQLKSEFVELLDRDQAMLEEDLLQQYEKNKVKQEHEDALKHKYKESMHKTKY